MKKVLFPLIVAAIVIITGIAIYASTRGENKSPDSTNNDTESQPKSIDFDSGDSVRVENPLAILFYGNGCPHCKEVDEWLTANNVTEKVKFDRLEVRYNKDNSNLLKEKATSCGLTNAETGVPFLYDIEKKSCLSGTDKVIEFFKSKI